MTIASSERVPVLLAHSYYICYDPKQLRKMKPYPPLSTLISAAVLREAGVPFRFFDSMLSAGVEEFVARLEAERPAIVAILEDNFNFLTKMCTVRMREAALEMIRGAKRLGCRVAVNGSDAIDRTADYLVAGADAVIIGETESTLLELVHAWLGNLDTDLTEVPGLALARADSPGVRQTRSRPAARDLDAFPLPAWDLVDAAAYRGAWQEAHGRFSWNACTSRGCPFGCNWCAKPVFGRRYTQRSPANVAEELAALARDIGPDHLWFADDIFGLTPRWIEAFADEMEARRVRIPFVIQSRADLMTPGAVAALVRAGCEEVWMGVESGSQKVLDAMDKDLDLSDVREGTARLKDAGIHAGWFIQLGYPGEEWPDLLATRDLIRTERPNDIGVSVAYPLPGTEFYDRVRAELWGKENWSDSDDLAMLFRGTYRTDFYRRVRDLLHAEVTALQHAHPMMRWPFDADWDALERVEAQHRAEPRRPDSQRAALG